jgi:hypothetical protein
MLVTTEHSDNLPLTTNRDVSCDPREAACRLLRSYVSVTCYVILCLAADNTDVTACCSLTQSFVLKAVSLTGETEIGNSFRNMLFRYIYLHTCLFTTDLAIAYLRRSRYSYLLRAGRSRDRIPVGAGHSAPVQTGPGAHPARVCPGVKRPGHGVDNPPYLAPKLKKELLFEGA